MSDIRILSEDDLLVQIKKALGISGTYQDDTLKTYINEVKEYMTDAGVNSDIVNSSVAIGAIARGVSDLWNYGSGNAELSTYFLQRVTQLAFKEV